MKRILILAILLMSSLAWAGSTTVVVGQGMGIANLGDFSADANCVGAWSFENNLNDSSGDSQTLTNNVGTISYDTDDLIKWGSYSAYFNDDRQLTRTNANLSASFPGKNGYTPTALSVVCWIKPAQVGVIQQIAGVVDFTACWSLDLLADNTIEFKLWNDSQAATSKVSTTTVSSGSEYHVAATWDGSYMRLYVNGIAEGSPVAHTGIEDDELGGTPFVVGYVFNTTYAYAGYIDELAVFNDCLSADEIASIYAHGLTGSR